MQYLESLWSPCTMMWTHSENHVSPMMPNSFVNRKISSRDS